MSDILKQKLEQAKNKQQEQVITTTEDVINALKQARIDLIDTLNAEKSTIKNAIQEAYNPETLIAAKNIEQQVTEAMKLLETHFIKTLDQNNQQTYKHLQQALQAKTQDLQKLLQQDTDNYNNLYQATHQVVQTATHLIQQINQAQQQQQHAQTLIKQHHKAVMWVIKYPIATAIALTLSILTTLALVITMWTQPDIYIDPKNKDHSLLQQMVHTTHTINSEVNKTKITTHQLIFPRRETTPYYTREIKFTPENPSNLELQGNPILEVIITQTPEQQTAYRLANTPKEQ